MTTIICFVCDYLTKRYLSIKKEGEKASRFFNFICELVIPEIKKFVDEFYEIISSRLKIGYVCLMPDDELRKILLNNRNVSIDRYILEIAGRYDCLSYLFLFAEEFSIKIKMDRDISIKILNEVFLNPYLCIDVNSFDENKLAVFRHCVPYLEYKDMEILLSRIMEESEAILSEEAKMRENFRVLIGPTLTEPIKYLCRATFNKKDLERCADLMALNNSNERLEDHHEIMSLYIEVGTMRALGKMSRYIKEMTQPDRCEEDQQFVKYYDFLIGEVSSRVRQKVV